MYPSKAEARPVQELGLHLTHSLFARLGRAIVTGEYDKMPFPVEMELVRQYSVSHGVIREAVKMLGAKGLVSARPRQGTVVAPMESWNLFDTDILSWLLERRPSSDLLARFNELRVAIEPEAAAIAACCAKSEDLNRIERGLERMRAAACGMDDALDADIAFHIAILEAAQNPFYIRFCGLIASARQASVRFINLAENPPHDIGNHFSVLNAILARDPDRARLAMRKIIGGVDTSCCGLNWSAGRSASADPRRNWCRSG